MSSIRFRNPEVRISAALAEAERGVQGQEVTLRDLVTVLGEQGLLVFCGVLAAPFLFPVTVPMMSTVFGLPMLLIGFAVMASRVPWLPDRLLDHRVSAETVRAILRRVAGWALRFEHLVRPRLLGMTGSARINAVNGALLVIAVLALMAPLPLVPFANTIPAVAILLLCFGMAERDGAVIALGWLATLLAIAYVGTLLLFVLYAGLHYEQVFRMLRDIFGLTA